MDDANEYRILDRNPITNRFVSINQPNCSVFIAGVVEGILNSCKMDCLVSVRVVENKNPPPLTVSIQEVGLPLSNKTTIFIIKFTDEVLERKVA